MKMLDCSELGSEPVTIVPRSVTPPSFGDGQSELGLKLMLMTKTKRKFSTAGVGLQVARQ